MCIIASIPKNTGIVNESTLENMCNNNSHGFGIGWIDNDNKIKIFKTMDKKQFIEKALNIQKHHSKTSDILIHARIATSGKTNVDNCHPFRVSDDTIFAHNGVLDCVEPTDSMSDTRVFNEVVLKNFKKDFLNNEGIRDFLGEIIGTDKLVFLTNNPAYSQNTFIINKDQGVTDNKVWFSNRTYQKARAVSLYSNNTFCEYDYYNYGMIDTPEENEPIEVPEIVMEFGSIQAYLDSYGDESASKKLDTILDKMKETQDDDNLILVTGKYTDIDEAKNIFNSDEYKIEYVLNDDLKKLLVKMYNMFVSRSLTKNDLTTKDYNSIMWDCFGRALPITIKKSNQTKFVFDNNK